MLAKRMPSILPPLTFEEALETTKIHSISGLLDPKTPIITKRPFRSPHHTISSAGLSGGGSVPHPGEVSLAHNGLLFLDELAEFDKHTLEVLRQPLEDGQVTISRVSGSYTYPCTIMIIGAMNPCPCGYYGHPTRKCICSQKKVQQYQSKISGPLLERIDLHIEVAPVEFADLSSKNKEESSAEIRKRVIAARNIQSERFKGTSIICNALITPDKLQDFCPMDDSALNVLESVFDKLGLSARSYNRIVKVARTIADLDNSEVISKRHIFSAVQYRTLDRKFQM
jgi:magnesium chelatase family protein